MSVRKTSFSARRWAATAAAAVSALTFSQPPSASRASDGMTGTTPAGAEVFDQRAVHARHLADAAQVDRLAVRAGQQQPFAEQALQASRHAGRRPGRRAGGSASTMPALISLSRTRTTMSRVASSV